MKRFVLSLLMGLCALGAVPRQAAAQCHETCTYLLSPDGKIIGRGCVFDLDSPTTCLATARICFTGDCGNAAVVDANGTLLAEAEICSGKVTLRNLSPAPSAKVTIKAAHDTKPARLARAASGLRVSG